MFRIQPDNKIQLTKGDTATIQVEAYDNDNKPYAIKSTDVVTLKVKKTQNSLQNAILKTADANHIITILPSDTSSLTSGLYVYDVQITTNEGNVYTIIPLNYFELIEEIS